MQVGRQRRARRHGGDGQRGDHDCDGQKRALRAPDRLNEGLDDEEGADDQARDADGPAGHALGEHPPDARHRDRQADEGDEEPDGLLTMKTNTSTTSAAVASSERTASARRPAEGVLVERSSS